MTGNQIFSRLPIGMLAAFVIAMTYQLLTSPPKARSESRSVPGGTVDTCAYNMGAERAIQMLQTIDDSIYINNSLLEVRANESSIKREFGDDAAKSYVGGFEDKVRELNDSLARRLFN